MAKVCARCNGTGKQGRQLCRACNSSGAIGDIVIGKVQQIWDKVTGRSVTTDGRTTTRRTHRLGTQTVSLTQTEKRARQQQATTGRRPTKTRQQSEVRGQQTSTAAKTGRCAACRGVYGLTKGARVRAHKDLTTGHRCPGGGQPAKAGRPKQVQQQPQRAAAPPPTPTRPAAPAARTRPLEATAEQISPDRRRKVVDAVRVEFAADKVEPHEIVLAANGEIWIDRRGRDPRNVPMPVGRWKPA